MHKNEELLRTLVAAFRSKDVETIASLFSPDIVWRWLGTEFITDIEPGTYVGLDSVAQALGGVDSNITDYQIDDILAVSASDQIGTLWMACSYTDAEGVFQKMEENWVFLFADDRVSEVWDYSRMVFLEKVRNGEVA
ncbi:MAG: nuclear transport factor 2 family protein [Pseudomonadota bacterium]